MNWTPILYAMAALGGLGLVFGLVLTFAAKVFAVQVDERIVAVRALLPGANCGACGFPGCDGFADAVVAGKAPANGCPVGGATVATGIGEVLGVAVTTGEPVVARVICQGAEGVSKERYVYDGLPSCAQASSLAGGPKKCPYACVGWGDCKRVCSFDAIQIVNGLAVIDENLCTACGNCQKACPRQSIKMLPRSEHVIVRCQNRDTARAAREQCSKPCMGCKRCVRECPAAAIVVENGFAIINPALCTECGQCAKVCPSGCIEMLR